MSDLEPYQPPPRPRKGDQLVRSDQPDWKNNACLSVGEDQLAYVEGYKLGAQRLVQHVVETHSDQDFLVYPIIFLFRHHIELALKRIISRAPYLIEHPLTEQQKKRLMNSHNLDCLWKDLKPMIGAVCEVAGCAEPAHADIQGLDDYIRQLHEFDAGSFAFRYAHNNQGSPSLPADLKQINVRHFSEMMERLASYLEGIDEATEQLLETKGAMEAEWRNEKAQDMDYE